MSVLTPGKHLIRGVEIVNRFLGDDGYEIIGRRNGEIARRLIPYEHFSEENIARVQLIVIRHLVDPPTLANPYPDDYEPEWLW